MRYHSQCFFLCFAVLELCYSSANGQPQLSNVAMCDASMLKILSATYDSLSLNDLGLNKIKTDSTMVCAGNNCYWQYDSFIDTALSVTYDKKFHLQGCVDFTLFDPLNSLCNISVADTDIIVDSLWGATQIRPGSSNRLHFNITTGSVNSFRLCLQASQANPPYTTTSNCSMIYGGYSYQYNPDSVEKWLQGSWRWRSTYHIIQRSYIGHSKWELPIIYMSLVFKSDTCIMRRNNLADSSIALALSACNGNVPACITLPDLLGLHLDQSYEYPLEFITSDIFMITRQTLGVMSDYYNYYFFRDSIDFQVPIKRDYLPPSFFSRSSINTLLISNSLLKIALAMPKPGRINAEIIDCLGKVVLAQSFMAPAGSSQNLINCRPLPSGMYFIRLKANGDIIGAQALLMR